MNTKYFMALIFCCASYSLVHGMRCELSLIIRVKQNKQQKNISKSICIPKAMQPQVLKKENKSFEWEWTKHLLCVGTLASFVFNKFNK